MQYISLILLVENGTLIVNENYPNGAYLRNNVDGSDYEVTPFTSIPIGIYWAIGTVAGSGNFLDYFYNCTIWLVG